MTDIVRPLTFTREEGEVSGSNNKYVLAKENFDNGSINKVLICLKI